MSDDILSKLLVSFKAEQRDHLEKIRGILLDMAKSGEGPGPELEEAFRRAHSLKGAARAVDLRPIETLAHCVETIFSRVREGRLPLDKRTLKTIEVVLDSIEDWVAAYFQKKTPQEPVKALGAVEDLLGTEIKPSAPAQPDRQPGPPGAVPVAEEALKVSARSLERLMIASDRVFAEMSRQGTLAKKLHAVESSVLDMELERDRVKRGRGRVLDFVDRKVRLLRKDLRELRLAQTRVSWGLKTAGERLKDTVLQARMVPADSVFQGLRKMARDLARDEGKELEFITEGLDLQADRLVLQALKDPLMHLLRNSVSHGIESPADRRACGKEAAGTVRLSLKTRGNQLLISVADDGRGVGWKAAAEYAVKRRFLSPEDAAAADTEELSRLLFLPGFTTTKMVTDLAGRGMGLSVVSEAVKRLQGRVTLRSEESAGMRLEIVVPISISSHRLLILKCAGRLFAIPVSALERLVQVPLSKIETVQGRSAVAVADHPVPIASLAGLIGLGDVSLKVAGETLPLAVLKSAGGSIGVGADEFVTEVESVVKTIRGGAERVRVFTGAVLTDEGAVVLVLDPGAIIERFKALKDGSVLRTEKAPPPKPAPTVLVVDDSVTTRTLEKSILEAHGYQVILAVDGAEALHKLRAEQADLAIVDIQMPRMDGFQLIEHLKKDPKLAKIPVIIVSSLESKAEKERGMSLGADAYIIKRKFDHKGLLDAIRQIL